MVKFCVPIPPSVNHCYWYHGNRKQRTKVATSYCDGITRTVQHLIKDGTEPFREKEKVRCKMWFYFPDARNRDTHNTLKLLLDAIEAGGLYHNDRYVLITIVDFDVDKINPRVELEMEYERKDAI